MDEIVARSLAKWPNVPAVYGWLSLDRRGNWLIRSGYGATPRFERIGNRALREFIARNYAADESGCWFFQNGPQRVFVTLAYTPLVMHYEGESLLDHCGRPTQALETLLDDEGSVLIRGERGIGLLDDRDLERYAEIGENLPRIARSDVALRFGYVPNPAHSLR
jgi:hypothetical protein